MRPRLPTLALAGASMLAAAPAPAQTLSGISPSGTWRGTYVCAQGRTGVALTVEPVGGGAVRAVMKFYATPANTGVPSGSYVLGGAVDPSSRRLRLVPEYWLSQPSGYTMVGLDGFLSADRYTGDVFGHPACTTFSVARG